MCENKKEVVFIYKLSDHYYFQVLIRACSDFFLMPNTIFMTILPIIFRSKLLKKYFPSPFYNPIKASIYSIKQFIFKDKLETLLYIMVYMITFHVGNVFSRFKLSLKEKNITKGSLNFLFSSERFCP